MNLAAPIAALLLSLPVLLAQQPPVCDQPLDQLIRTAPREEMERCLKTRIPQPAKVTPVESPLHDAALRGYLDVVRLLLRMKFPVDERDKLGNTPLHDASLKGRAEVVAALLEAGASPSAANSTGSTPLHEAALGGFSKVIELLLAAKGAGADALDAEGNTALHLAASFGRKEAVEALLHGGANSHLMNKRGLTPAKLATASGQAEVAAIFERH